MDLVVGLYDPAKSLPLPRQAPTNYAPSSNSDFKVGRSTLTRQSAPLESTERTLAMLP